MAVEEYLAVLVALLVAVAVVVVDADMDELRGLITPLITLHMWIEILKLKLSNILNNNLGSCLHAINLKFGRWILRQGG